MENQVEALQTRHIAAEFLCSQKSEADRKRILADISALSPSTKLLYVTPELLSSERQTLSAKQANEIAICIQYSFTVKSPFAGYSCV